MTPIFFFFFFERNSAKLHRRIPMYEENGFENPNFKSPNFSGRGLQGYTLIFLFLLINIDCGYLLELP